MEEVRQHSQRKFTINFRSSAELHEMIAQRYIKCGDDMDGRAPGERTMCALMLMQGNRTGLLNQIH